MQTNVTLYYGLFVKRYDANPSSVHLFSTTESVQWGEGVRLPLPGISPSRCRMNLKFVPWLPLVNWCWLVTSFTRSHDSCVIYRSETKFDDMIKNWKWLYESTSFIKETYFGKFQGLVICSTWETKKLL